MSTSPLWKKSRRRRGRRRAPTPVDQHSRRRLGEALQPEASDRADAEVPAPAYQAGDELAGQNLAALRLVAEALGHDHGRTVKIALGSHGFPGVHAHPHVEHPAWLDPVVFGDGPLNSHRAVQGLDGTGEDDHEPVAHALHLLALGCGHRLAQEGEVNAPQILGGVVTQPIEEFRRSDEVGEEKARHQRAVPRTRFGLGHGKVANEARSDEGKEERK